MKHILVLTCIFFYASAVPKDKQISLDDIERDLLSSERAPPPAKPPKLSSPAPSPTKFGFLPTRTAASYARQNPKPTHSQTSYTVQSLQNIKPHIKYSTDAPQYQQYAVPQQYSPEQQYVYQPTQYQQYENVQYVTDNSVIAPQETQQYYTPQYVYYQQYSAPSTSIQTVVDPKAGVQYVMYVPAYQNSVGDDQSYQSKYGGGSQDVQQYSTVPQVAYVPQKEEAKYTTVVQKEEGPTYKISGKSQYSKDQFGFKREPKSLLDSYVPSILQIKYLQELQKRQS